MITRFKYILLSSFIFLMISISSLLAEEVNTCTITNGIFAKDGASGGPIGSWCASAPESYEVIAYEMYLCTAAPTAPTTASSMGLDNCFKNWELTSGAVLSVQQNQTIVHYLVNRLRLFAKIIVELQKNEMLDLNAPLLFLH